MEGPKVVKISMPLKMDFNKYQTQLTKPVLEKYPKEVIADLYDYINNVPFLRHLVSKDRLYAKDLPIKKYIVEDEESGTEEEFEYEDGRKEIDITKPHFMEDLNFFRERALFFDKHGKYTHITPNSNPRSEYANFWREEVRRWKHGFVRESDGEWIPGGLYFYWNYSPIWLTKKSSGRSKRRAERSREFPKPWLGDYLFFHYMEQAQDAGKHGKILKCRGVGFSLKMASLSPRNMYVFKGSGNPNFHLASDKAFLSGDKGIWGKVLDCLDWIGDNTPLARVRLVDGKKAMELQLGYTDEFGKRKGHLSSVFGISLKHEPNKARGIRGPLIHYEEDGLFPDLEEAWNVNLAAVQDGGESFGFMLAGGTGGTQGASFEGSEKLFYRPGAYNIYGIPNVFDKNIEGKTLCGFFWPAYLNRNKCYDEENGEPNCIKAMLQILSERHEIKYSSSDPQAVTQKKAEIPVTPQEAIMRIEGTMFPVSDLKDYLMSVEPNIDSFTSLHYIGRLYYDMVSSSIAWKPDADVTILRDFPVVDNLNKAGGIEIFENPQRDGEGKPMHNRYIAGIDPYDDDHSTTDSLGSCFIFDTLTDRIVAEYTGRPLLANTFYENCARLLKYYDARANYENDKKGLYTYFSNNNITYLLCETPEILKDMNYVKGGTYGNKAVGTGSGKKINAWGRRLQADWMNTVAYNTDTWEEISDPDRDDTNEREELKNLHKIRSMAYIKEAIAWNPDGNFDRVSAMGMCMILREQYSKYNYNLNENNSSNILSNDSYFERNYDMRRNVDADSTDKSNINFTGGTFYNSSGDNFTKI